MRVLFSQLQSLPARGIHVERPSLALEEFSNDLKTVVAIYIRRSDGLKHFRKITDSSLVLVTAIVLI